MKRGQVTAFIIVGLVVLIAIILVYFANSEYLKDLFEEQRTKLTGIPAEIKPVGDYIQQCLDDVSKTGVDFVLLQGGYYEPKDYVELDLFRVAYWYDNKDISPSLEVIENEISKGINPLFKSCIDEYDSSYKINLTSLKTDVKIKEKKILFTSNVNMNVIYKDVTYTINKKYILKKDSDVFDIYNTAKTIIDSEVLNPDEIDLTFLAEIPYDINFFKTDTNEIIYTIISDKTTLYFANRFI